MTSQDREEIRRRREACTQSALHYAREHSYLMRRTQINLEYVQAECEHPETFKQYELSHFKTVCRDCGKIL